jgi:hypothetical protein
LTTTPFAASKKRLCGTFSDLQTFTISSLLPAGLSAAIVLVSNRKMQEGSTTTRTGGARAALMASPLARRVKGPQQP